MGQSCSDCFDSVIKFDPLAVLESSADLPNFSDQRRAGLDIIDWCRTTGMDSYI